MPLIPSCLLASIWLTPKCINIGVITKSDHLNFEEVTGSTNQKGMAQMGMSKRVQAMTKSASELGMRDGVRTCVLGARDDTSTRDGTTDCVGTHLCLA